MSEISEFAVKILKEYAEGEHCSVRHTHDISPLEGWLLSKLFTAQNTIDFNVTQNMNLINQFRDKPKWLIQARLDERKLCVYKLQTALEDTPDLSTDYIEAINDEIQEHKDYIAEYEEELLKH
jgi:hypothetical protein